MKIRFSFALILLLTTISARPQAAAPAGTSPSTTLSIPVDIETSEFMHGTIDIVLSTRQGFVLASDSRVTVLSQNGQQHRDDGQKLFQVGEHSACVVAGLVGATARGPEAFSIKSAVGTRLALLDAEARRPGSALRVDTREIVSEFAEGLQSTGVLLLEPRARGIDTYGGELSAVSVDSDGHFSWTGGVFQLEPSGDGRGFIELSIGKPTFYMHSTYVGPRFDVEVLGQPRIAITLLSAGRPGPIRHSHSAIMRRYYLLKGANLLDQLTIREGIELARELIQATIDLSPDTAGVGGPIDIAVLTKKGFRWVQRKSDLEELPPISPLVSDSTFGNAPQDLDNLNCLRCNFIDSHLFFKGEGDVQLVKPVFGGNCRLSVHPKAKERNPGVLARILRAMDGKCRVVEQTANYP